MKTVAIIGAGPAGIFTARLLRDFSGTITLFEQNEAIGEKLKLTGGGRMNVTNRRFSVDDFSSAAPQLLKNLFKSPWVERREEIFAAIGIDFFWEGDRAILASQNAVDEVARLDAALRSQKNLMLRTGAPVLSVETDGERFAVRFLDRGDVAVLLSFDAVVIATGGMFRLHDAKKTASEIYALPIALGHGITPIAPSLSPLRLAVHPLVSLAGIAFFGVLTTGKRSVGGDLLITHHGLSGPAALDFSAVWAGESATLAFSSIPVERFIERFLALRNGRHPIRSALRELLPVRLVDWHLQRLHIAPETLIAEISKEAELSLREALFSFPLRGILLGDYPQCWTTRGGVPLAEISVATLESKRHKNLFFAGEIVDANGLCGGYNISFAAISARLVADAIGK